MNWLLFTAAELEGGNSDIILLLNVLHHLGDDYGDADLSLAKANIITQLNSLADKTDLIIFQMGFNWKGDRNICLFNNGSKQEVIDYISSGIKNLWEIVEIGIAEREENEVYYNALNSRNIVRVDALCEFLNRPVFVFKVTFMKSWIKKGLTYRPKGLKNLKPGTSFCQLSFENENK